MKKRILILGLIIALVAVMGLPTVVLAGDTQVNGELGFGPLTHFAVTVGAGPFTAGTSFSIGPITALDASNNTVGDFVGTVDITETGGGAGGSVSPTTSGSFSSGVLSSINVTLTKAGTGVTITVTKSGGIETGTSTSFTVNPGAVAAVTSTVSASPLSVPKDGTTTSAITVTLKDADGNLVPSKTVTLAQVKSGGGASNSIIAPSGDSGISGSSTSDSSGVATFTVKDSTEEAVKYTATGDAVTITQTATVTFTAATINLTAPSAISLTLVNAPATDQEIVGSTTGAGSVTASGLGSGTYSISVSANNSGKLRGSVALSNALMIATGDSTAQLGNVASAAGVTGPFPKAYSGTDASYFTALTGSSQSIGSGLSANSVTLNLYVFQKIDTGESHTAGSYSLTLTYSTGASF